MGSSRGSSQVVRAEEVITPAVGRSISKDTASAEASQREARERMRGIRSTYSRFAWQGQAGGTGSSTRLG